MPPGKESLLNIDDFINQIDKHLLKPQSTDIFVDMSNFTKAQQSRVLKHLEKLSAEQRKRIITHP